MASRTKVLRLSAAEIADLVIRNRAEAMERRAAFLKANPAYIECVMKDCYGLVGPRFQRSTEDGRIWGFCPAATRISAWRRTHSRPPDRFTSRPERRFQRFSGPTQETPLPCRPTFS